MPLQVMKLTKSTEVVMNACQLTGARPIARAATCGPIHNPRPPDTNFRDMSIAEPPAASAQVQGVLLETVP